MANLKRFMKSNNTFLESKTHCLLLHKQQKLLESAVPAAVGCQSPQLVGDNNLVALLNLPRQYWAIHKEKWTAQQFAIFLCVNI